MSDLGRKNISDKVTEGLKPDQEKSSLEKAKETATDKVDSFVGQNVPEDQKSFPQTVADKASKGYNDAKNDIQENHGTFVDTAKSYVDTAKEKAADAAQYVSGALGGATEGAKTGAEETKK
ncbi:Piso0_000257 [Millerozyma farinosa CBS 7064]|uniref:Piso0_000257 protein n=1 Tax=Pichia sorbitophila (strain ATCC MYA-4447 / BCRC 22081 / CBS 7064 / NBRC 10061 / NRRL Y-12695) TaxID=559304 RepID=G8YUY4_PICSO|nr:Piso0_000257 [Millerozyma farinosa CBS 7064]